MRKELLEGLTKEQIARVKACKNTEEILELAKQEGIILTDEQLAAVNGGICTGEDEPRKCPNCGSTNITENRGTGREAETCFECNDCGAMWFLK